MLARILFQGLKIDKNVCKNHFETLELS